MFAYTIRFTQGIGYRVVNFNGKVCGTFDTYDDAEEHRDKLNSGELKESALYRSLPS